MTVRITVLLGLSALFISSCDRSDGPNAKVGDRTDGDLVGRWARKTVDDLQGQEVVETDTLIFSAESVWFSQTSRGSLRGYLRNDYSGVYSHSHDTLRFSFTSFPDTPSMVMPLTGEPYHVITRLDATALVLTDGVAVYGYNRIGSP